MATAESRTRPFGRALALDLEGNVVAALLGLAVVAPLASVDGGWSPTSWGWSSLAFAGIAITAILLRAAFQVSSLELVVLGALVAFAGWTLLSAAWSGDAGASGLSFERVLVYVTALAAAFAVVRPRSYCALLGGAWAAAVLVCGYAVLTRLYPDRLPANVGLAGNRLAAPVGYWNSLGLLAATGILLGVGFAGTTRSRVLRALAGASLVPLSLALYFTFSRGAWLVLAVGVVVAVALDPRRLRLAVGVLVLAPWVAFTVAQAAGTHALTTVQAVPAEAATAGAHVARISLLFALGAALTAVLAAEADVRVTVPDGARRAFAVALALAVVAALAAAGIRYGGPVAAWHSFTAKPDRVTSLNARLFTLSNNGRIELWRVALDDWRAHPLQGSGAGTYEREWLAHRPLPQQVVNAHNLYAETLAETGIVGLVLLLGALLAPLVAALRARRRRLVPIAAAAYAAFLVHVFFDWDWQLPGVALAPVLAAAALLVAARGEGAGGGRRTWAPYAAAGALAAVAAIAGLTLAGNRAVASAASAAAHEQWPRATAEARRAHTWQPWSSRPWQLLGEVQLQQGLLAPARSSFRTALAKNPRNWRLWLDLAFASETPAARRAAAARAAALNPLSTEIDQVRPALGLPKRP
jgi:O-antigen ligase